MTLSSRHFGGRGPMAGGPDKMKLVVLLSCFVVLLFAIVGVLYLKPEDSSSPTTVVIEREPEMKMVDILVPIKEVKAGTSLQPSLFRKVQRLKASVDERVVTDFEMIQGMYSRSLLVPNQPLHMDLITNVRPTTAISGDIPMGYRAVSIRVNATSSVEGWARAGSKVDVSWASNINGEPAITTIVYNAKVLSAERQVTPNTQAGMPVPSTVTLLVTAADAKKIMLASTTGSLNLSLRGDTDVGKAEGASGGLTLQQLWGGEGKRPPQIPQSQGTVTMGGKKWVVSERGDLIPLSRDQ